MDLKAFEKRRVRGLYRRIIRNLNSRRRYAERKGRGFTPDSESIQKQCYYLLDTLDCFYLRDQAFHRDPDCWHKKKDSVTSVSLNLQNVENCSAVHSQRNYCQNHYQRMSLMKRVRIGGSFFGRTPTIQIVWKVTATQDGRWIYTSTKVLITSSTMQESMSTIYIEKLKTDTRGSIH